jgi:hypothetical protein
MRKENYARGGIMRIIAGATGTVFILAGIIPPDEDRS